MRRMRSGLSMLTVVLLAVTAAACGGDDEETAATSAAVAAATSAPETTAAAEEATSAEEATTAAAEATTAAAEQERVTIGFVVHVKGNPFIQSIIRAAEDAAEDYNVDLKVSGPEGFDPDAQLKMVEDVIAAGAQGVATSIPGESMANRINAIIDDGTPIVMFNIYSAKIKSVFVGERTVAAWKGLGEDVLEKVGGAETTGSVIIGYCAPGLPVLEDRVKGLKQAFEGTKLETKGPFDVKVDPAETYARWEALAQANPDAKAFIGVCAPDPATLGKLNAANDDKWVMAGADFTTENLKAIEEKHTLAALGQMPYVQGYLPVKMIAEALREGKEIPQGFIESGVETLTETGATQPYGLPELDFATVKRIQTDQALARSTYTPLFMEGGELFDWTAKVEPLSAASE